MVAVANGTATGQREINEPWLTTTEARARLGVSRRVWTKLIARNVLLPQANIYDRRVKQIARADVERVLRDGVDGMRPPRRKGGDA